MAVWPHARYQTINSGSSVVQKAYGDAIQDQIVVNTELPGKAWVFPSQVMKVGAGNLTVSIVPSSNQGPLWQTAGANGATTFYVPLNFIQYDNKISAVDVFAGIGGPTIETFALAKQTGYTTGGFSFVQTLQSLQGGGTTANLTNASLYEVVTLTLATPILVDATMTFYLVWTAQNTTSQLFAIRVY